MSSQKKRKVKQTSKKFKSEEARKKYYQIKNGFRSGLEEKVADALMSKGVKATYETTKIKYIVPAKERTYTPDFVLPNGIIVETKGRFLTADRQKHLLVKEQHPDLDIRFIFSNAQQKINKYSKTTYAEWCEKNGFKYAEKNIPEEWLYE